jgi:transcription initiation factor TFIIB
MNLMVFPMKQLRTACSACKSEEVITDHESGEIICSNCGLVISENIQDRDNWWMSLGTRGPDLEANGVLPISLARHDKGLSTTIGRPNKDASGHVLDSEMRSRMERLRRWDFRIKASNSHDGNLKDALAQLDSLKDKLQLPETVVEKTAYIYRKAQTRGLVRGRTISAVLDAALYIACRELGIPKSLKEIAGANNVKHKTLAKSYRLLIVELDVKIPTVDPTKCIIKVSNKVNLEERTKRRAIVLMSQLISMEVTAGKDPMGMAAAVLYISCMNSGEKRTQSDIARAAGITEMTLRNRCRSIKDLEPDLVPISIVSKGHQTNHTIFRA